MTGAALIVGAFEGLAAGILFGALLCILAGIWGALATIAEHLKNGAIQTRDIDRTRVYSEHLGAKMKGQP